MRVCTVIGISLVAGAGLLAGPSQAAAAKPVFTVSSTIHNVGNLPVAIAVDPARHYAYVVDTSGHSVVVRNTVSHARVATVPVSQDGLDALAIDTTTHTVWVVNQYFGAATVIDENTNTVVDTILIATSQGEQPTAIAIDPARHRAYVSNLDHTTVVLDTQHRRVLTTWPNVGAGGVAIDRSRNVVLVAAPHDGTVTFVDAPTGTILKTLNTGHWPSFIAIDPRLDRAYVTGSVAANTITMLDLSLRKQLGSVPTQDAPDGVAVDSRTGTVYVANGFDASVSMFRASDLAVLGLVPTADGSIDVAVDPVAHRAFVLNSVANTISVVDRTVAQSLRATT
jgi:DNA-binding beta-propeller fold protein YncE